MKDALVMRAGPSTKIVCLGKIAQIYTYYLAEGSSGRPDLNF